MLALIILLLSLLCFIGATLGMPDTWGIKLEGLGLVCFVLACIVNNLNDPSQWGE